MTKHLKLAAVLIATVTGLTLVACAPPSGTPTTSTTTSTAPATHITVTGRLVDSVRRTPVAGLTVKVTNLDELHAGALVDRTGVTAADGTFSIDGGLPSTFWLFVITTANPDYRAGAVRCIGSYQVADPAGYYCDFSSGSVGDVNVNWTQPWTFTGQILDSASSAAVNGAKVTLTDLAGTPLVADYVAFTDSSGKFGFTVPNEVTDFGVLIDGSNAGYETGFLSGAVYGNGLKKVVPTFAEASSWAPLSLGGIGLDPLP